MLPFCGIFGSCDMFCSFTGSDADSTRDASVNEMS